MIPLTKGAIMEILQKRSRPKKPVLQILANQILPADKEYYKLNLSDGEISTSLTLMSTSLNHMIHDNRLSDNTIVAITRYAVTFDEYTKENILVVISLEIKVAGDRIGGPIGYPVPYHCHLLSVAEADAGNGPER